METLAGRHPSPSRSFLPLRRCSCSAPPSSSPNSGCDGCNLGWAWQLASPPRRYFFWCLAPFFVDASGGDGRAVVLFACVGLLFPGAAALLNFESNRLMGPNIAGALSSMTPVLAVLLAV